MACIIVFYAHFNGIYEKEKKNRKRKKNGSLYSAFDKCISCDGMRAMIDLLLLTHQTLRQLVSLLVLGVLEKL